MVYRITGGLAFLFLGFSAVGFTEIPPIITGVLLIVAGIALLAGQ